MIVLLLVGCGWISGSDLERALDGDGDGFVAKSRGGDDCDDTRADVYPGAEDAWYDGVDADCAGNDDYDADRDGRAAAGYGGSDCDDADPLIASSVQTWYPDCDGDGRPTDAPQDSCGAPASTPVCQPDRWVRARADLVFDCDDADPGVAPDLVDTPYNGRDEDCDGADDFDADHDGYPHPAYLDQTGLTTAPDCDDADPLTWPGAVDAPYDGIDRDCDPAGEFDVDGDGASFPDDCNDQVASIHPGATEVWYDGIDQDCDGGDDFDQDGDSVPGPAWLLFDPTAVVDCDDLDPTRNPFVAEVWYDGVDQDCDGRDDDRDGDGALFADDCDDQDASRYPGAIEIPGDGVDQACNGMLDEYDLDGDGYVAAMWQAVAGADLADCDDTDPFVYPGAEDTWYDGVDQDCAGDDDFDRDGDGAAAATYGGTDCDDDDPTRAPGLPDPPYDGIDTDCAGDDDYDADDDGFRPALYGGTDCDDANATSYPGSFDIPDDGVDQDCDGLDATDVDGDGFAGLLGGGQDCDDLDSSVFPGASEHWYDGVDQDCDGADDYDQDGDGSPIPLDCDDLDPSIAPGLADLPYDGIDTDCADPEREFDVDGDGWSPAGLSIPPGQGLIPGDCDDLDASVQACPGIDEDGDGYTAYADDARAAEAGLLPGDCNDDDAAIHPGQPELWYDGIDQDCSGGSDFDQDGDGRARFPEGLDACDTVGTRWMGNVRLDLLGNARIAPPVDPDAFVVLPPVTTLTGQTLPGVLDQVCPVAAVSLVGTFVFPVPMRVDAQENLLLRADGAVTLLGVSGAVLTVEGERLRLEGLTLEGGVGASGGCIQAANTELVLEDTTLQGCSASGDGGGLAFTGERLTLIETVFRGNDAGGRGGGLFVEGAEQVTVLGLRSELNRAARGGGWFLREVGTVDATDVLQVVDRADEAPLGVLEGVEQTALGLVGVVANEAGEAAIEVVESGLAGDVALQGLACAGSCPVGLGIAAVDSALQGLNVQSSAVDVALGVAGGSLETVAATSITVLDGAPTMCGVTVETTCAGCAAGAELPCP